MLNNIFIQVTSLTATIISFILFAIAGSVYLLKTKDLHKLETYEMAFLITGVSGILAPLWPVLIVVGVPLVALWSLVYMIIILTRLAETVILSAMLNRKMRDK